MPPPPWVFRHSTDKFQVSHHRRRQDLRLEVVRDSHPPFHRWLMDLTGTEVSGHHRKAPLQQEAWESSDPRQDQQQLLEEVHFSPEEATFILLRRWFLLERPRSSRPLWTRPCQGWTRRSQRLRTC
jgi:hypothetical protein